MAVRSVCESLPSRTQQEQEQIQEQIQEGHIADMTADGDGVTRVTRPGKVMMGQITLILLVSSDVTSPICFTYCQ